MWDSSQLHACSINHSLLQETVMWRKHLFDGGQAVCSVTCRTSRWCVPGFSEKFAYFSPAPVVLKKGTQMKIFTIFWYKDRYQNLYIMELISDITRFYIHIK